MAMRRDIENARRRIFEPGGASDLGFYDVGDGVATRRRLWMAMRQYPGRPDGAAVNVDGCYWICGNDAGAGHRFTPEARLNRTARVPAKKLAMCSLGGPSMDTLFATSIRSADASVEVEQPLPGGIRLFPRVAGIAEQPFQPEGARTCPSIDISQPRERDST